MCGLLTLNHKLVEMFPGGEIKSRGWCPRHSPGTGTDRWWRHIIMAFIYPRFSRMRNVGLDWWSAPLHIIIAFSFFFLFASVVRPCELMAWFFLSHWTLSVSYNIKNILSSLYPCHISAGNCERAGNTSRILYFNGFSIVSRSILLHSGQSLHIIVIYFFRIESEMLKLSIPSFLSFILLLLS